MELLKFNQHGQWTLVKDEPKPSTEYTGQPDTNFLSYRTRALEGRLPADHGQRGSLHNVGTVRPPRQASDDKMKGKMPSPIKGAQTDRNPGTASDV